MESQGSKMNLTKANKDESFPTNADFDKAEHKPAIKWRELTQGIYRIEGRREFNTQHGNALILSLYKPGEDGIETDVVEVWAPERLQDQLKNKPSAEYIRKNGLKTSQKNRAHQYHSFDLM